MHLAVGAKESGPSGLSPPLSLGLVFAFGLTAFLAGAELAVVAAYCMGVTGIVGVVGVGHCVQCSVPLS